MKNKIDNVILDVSDNVDVMSVSRFLRLCDDEDDDTFVDQDTGEVIQKSKIEIEPAPKIFESKSSKAENNLLPDLEIDSASFSKLNFNRDVSQAALVLELTQELTRKLVSAAAKIESAPGEMKSIIEGISRDLDLEARESFNSKYVPAVRKQLRTENEEMLLDAQEEIDAGVEEALTRIKAQSEDIAVSTRLLVSCSSKAEEATSTLIDLVKTLKLENEKKERLLTSLRKENAGVYTRIIRVFFKNYGGGW